MSKTKIVEASSKSEHSLRVRVGCGYLTIRMTQYGSFDFDLEPLEGERAPTLAAFAAHLRDALNEPEVMEWIEEHSA